MESESENSENGSATNPRNSVNSVLTFSTRKSQTTVQPKIKEKHKYIPRSRMEQLKEKQIPLSSPFKIYIASNLEGNGFRWHDQDIDNLFASQDQKQQIRDFVIQINRECYKIWEHKKIRLQNEQFKSEKRALGVICLVMLCLCLILLFGGFQQQTAYLVMLSIVLSIALMLTALSIIVYAKKYSQNSLETDIKNLVRRSIRTKNGAAPNQKLKWKTTMQSFWISVEVTHQEQSQIL